MTETELIEAKRAFHATFKPTNPAGPTARKMRAIFYRKGVAVLHELPDGGWTWSITAAGVGRKDAGYRFFTEGEAVEHLADHLIDEHGVRAIADATRWLSRCRGGRCGVRLSREATPCASK